MGKVQGNKNQTLAFLSHGGVNSSPWGNPNFNNIMVFLGCIFRERTES